MKKILLLLLVIILSVGFLAGCSSNNEETVTWTIDINGTSFTNVDYSKLEEVEVTAIGISKDGLENDAENWKGITLKDALGAVGADGYSVVTIEAADGYAKDIDDINLIDSNSTIIATAFEGTALTEEEGYAQLVVDGARTSLWIKNLAKITTK